MQRNKNYVMGVDYGTDSVRAVVIDAADGSEAGAHVHYYKRWAEGTYCDPPKNQFRQHPWDYIEGLENAVTKALAQAPDGTAEKVRGISVDTTGSTPCAVDKNGTPLSLTSGFEENPNAMFVLWKDHTGVKEAEEINQTAQTWGGEDFTKYSGGIYSSEWFWSKILHILREDERVSEAAFSWVEHCDWIPALLTGNSDPLNFKRSRTAAGHKAMWHASWGGLPCQAFLSKLDPVLDGIRERLYTETFTADVPAGTLTQVWADKLGLSSEVVVGVGSFDAHLGAVGAQCENHQLVKVMGTSTCDMITTAFPAEGEHLVKGICGQVDGSILPGVLGFEAGQSGFGDIYAWFKHILLWPMGALLDDCDSVDDAAKGKLRDEIAEKLIPKLSEAAAQVPVAESSEIALDWMNGRRTPDANQTLKGVIAGLNLGSDAPRIFRALVEATAFGAKKIVDRFVEEGIAINSVLAIGGIARKSPFVMQTTADVLNMPIKVVASEQACALGAAMAAATAAGLYAAMEDAQKALGSGFENIYEPVPQHAEKYKMLYARYSGLAALIENEFTFTNH